MIVIVIVIVTVTVRAILIAIIVGHRVVHRANLTPKPSLCQSMGALRDRVPYKVRISQTV